VNVKRGLSSRSTLTLPIEGERQLKHAVSRASKRILMSCGGDMETASVYGMTHSD
jgi:hypothetical protein